MLQVVKNWANAIVAAVASLRGNAPANLNDMGELSAAIENDPAFGATIRALIALKQSKSAALDVLSTTSPTALATAIINAQEGSDVLDLIGGQSLIVDGTYWTPAQGEARIQQIVGAAPEAMDTLEEIAEFLDGQTDAIGAINGVLAGKQPLDGTLTALSGKATAALGMSLLGAGTAAAARGIINAQIAGDYQGHSTLLDEYVQYLGTIAPNTPGVLRRLVWYAPNGEEAFGDTGQEKFWSIELTEEMAAALDNAGASDGAFRTSIRAQAQSDKLDSLVEYLPNNPHPFGKAYAMFYRPEGWDGNADQLWMAASLTEDAISDIASGFSRFQLQSSVLDQVVQQVTQVQPGDSNFLFSYLPGNNSVSSLPFSTFGSSLLGKGAAGEAGKVYYNSGLNGGALSITTTATSRAIMARQPAAVGEIVFASDLTGGISTVTTGTGGRNLMSLASPATGTVPYFSDGAGTVSFAQSAAQGRSLLNITGAVNQAFYFNVVGTLTAMGVGTFGRGVLALATPAAGSVPYATDAAGAVGTFVSTAAGRNLVAQAVPAAGAVNYFTDAAGAVGTVVSGVGGRNLLALTTPATGSMAFFSDAAGTVSTVGSTPSGRSLLSILPASNQVPFFNATNGSAGFINANAYGRGVLALSTPAAGSVPYATDAAGTIGTITTTAYGRNLMAATGAQAVRGLAARKAATFYTTAAVNLLAANQNAPTEVSWGGMDTKVGFDQANAALSGTRIQANSTSLAWCSVSGSIVTTGPCDIWVDMSLTSTAGAAYVPTAGDGISRPQTAQVPGGFMIKCRQAGTVSFVGPQRVPLSTVANLAQLRVSISTSQDVTITSMSLELDQHALEVIT